MLEKRHEYFYGVGYHECVKIGIQTFMIREGEEHLPIQKAWCKNCAQESAKVVFAIHMNGRPAYALECTKCGNAYHMYQSMFQTRYIGHTTPSGGYYAPTHGVLSRQQVMDRKAKEEYNNIPKKVEEETCRFMNISKEEYREMKKGWDEKNKKVQNKIKQERAEIKTRITENKIKQESDERKDLIARGVLKYVKGIGLVNTETNQVIKL